MPFAWLFSLAPSECFVMSRDKNIGNRHCPASPQLLPGIKYKYQMQIQMPIQMQIQMHIQTEIQRQKHQQQALPRFSPTVTGRRWSSCISLSVTKVEFSHDDACAAHFQLIAHQSQIYASCCQADMCYCMWLKLNFPIMPVRAHF